MDNTDSIVVVLSEASRTGAAVGVDWHNGIMFIIALIPLLVAVVVYFIKHLTMTDSFYRKCANSLYSDSTIEQATAAILLRDFIKKRKYARNTKNIMVALLRTSIPVSLQKTIADIFSYANSLKGQDFQYINMLDALIKPQSRIDYELKGGKRYKRKRLSMRQADCYHAIIQECSINNIDASKAVFYCANISGTSFRNCLFRDANFKCAYVKGARFDEDCVLDGAVFEHAVGLDSAWVSVSQKTTLPLINFLDNKGVFRQYQREVRYTPVNQKFKIFVSKLGAMDAEQRGRYQGVLSVISSLENTSLDSIERKHYPIVSQLPDVMSHLDNCDGCVLFAFEYMFVNEGCIHKNIVENDEDHKQIVNEKLVSPWLHIEAALANSKSMPCLIIYDKDLRRDGMFDDTIVNPDKNLFSLEYTDSIEADNEIIKKWMSRVYEYHYRNRN